MIMTALEEIMEKHKGNFEASYQTRGVLITMENFHSVLLWFYNK